MDVIGFDGNTISLVTSGEYLSVARTNLAVTTINVNGVDYAVFGGGYTVDTFTDSTVVDVIGFDGNTISLVTSGEYLSVARYSLTATTINVNGTDYAVFGGGITKFTSTDIDIITVPII